MSTKPPSCCQLGGFGFALQEVHLRAAAGGGGSSVRSYRLPARPRITRLRGYQRSTPMGRLPPKRPDLPRVGRSPHADERASRSPSPRGAQLWAMYLPATSLSHQMRGSASRSPEPTHRTASVEPLVSGRTDPNRTSTS
jgi:hypothetical protein